MDHAEEHRVGTTRARLRLRDSWKGITADEIARRLADGDSWWEAEVYDPLTGRWYDVVELGSAEHTEHFDERGKALQRASIIARDIADARVNALPDWGRDDLSTWLPRFLAAVPNRVDYVRLLWSNDPNGSYDGLLAEPVRVAHEVFEDTFEDYLAPATNPIDGIKAALLTF